MRTSSSRQCLHRVSTRHFHILSAALTRATNDTVRVCSHRPGIYEGIDASGLDDRAVHTPESIGTMEEGQHSGRGSNEGLHIAKRWQ